MTSPLHGSGPAFIGRDDELAQLQARLSAARSGSGGLVLLSGPPGIGKSRLAAEFMHEATSQGVRVLLGRSWEAGGAPPYWPWVQAMRGYLRTADRDTLIKQLGDGASALTAMLPELGQIASPAAQSSSGEPASDRFHLFESLSTFLRNLSQSEPLVVVLEDLQAADVPTLLLLEFVTGDIAETGVLIIATYRDIEVTPEHALTSSLAKLQRAPVTTQMVLRGLDAREVARFIEATAGTTAPSALTATLHRQTSGNPLFLGETVRLLTSDTDDGQLMTLARGVVPAEVRAVIARRLEGLSHPCLTNLETASVLGNDFSVEVAARVNELEVDSQLDLLGEAIRAGLVVEARGGPGTFGFAHDVIRHTLYAGLAPAQRTRIHRRCAEILEEIYGIDGDDHLAEVALHYFEAFVGGDHTKAVEYGRRAGEQAVHRLAYEEAVRLFEMAEQVLEGSERANQLSFGELLLSLADARVRAGNLPDAGKAFLRAAEIARRVGDPGLLARAAIGYGGRFIWARAGSDTQMIPLLQDALVLLGGADDRLRVRLLSRLACASRSDGDREHGAALARQALHLARQLGEPETVAYALSALAGATWWPENSAERLEMGRELVSIGDIESVIDGHMTQCAALAELGDFAGARRELERLGHVGGPLRLLSQRWLEGAMEAVFALSDGRFEEAEPWIEEMLRQAPTTPARDNISAAQFQRFLLRREQGRLAEIEEPARQAANEFPWYQIHRLALADVYVRTGRVEDGRSIVEELASDGFAALPRDNYWLPSMCLAAELVAFLGDVEKAHVLIDALRPFASLNAVAFPEGSFGAVSRYLGLLAGVVGDYDSAMRWFDEALALNDKNGARTWVAHIHHDWAEVLFARGGPGDEAQARTHLVTALHLCEEVGLDALRDTVLAMTGSTPTPDPSPTDHSSEASVFRRDGEFFSIAFEGSSFKMKDSKGLRYLVMLLASPGREIHVLDLVAGERGIDASSRNVIRDDDQHSGMETSISVLDRNARADYKRRLIELEDDITEAEQFGDQERASRARAEQEFLARELSASIGLGGRDRSAASNAERARVNVTRALRSGLARIRSHDGVLGQHFDATIHTGVYCSYVPDPRTPVKWDL